MGAAGGPGGDGLPTLGAPRSPAPCPLASPARSSRRARPPRGVHDGVPRSAGHGSLRVGSYHKPKLRRAVEQEAGPLAPLVMNLIWLNDTVRMPLRVRRPSSASSSSRAGAVRRRPVHPTLPGDLHRRRAGLRVAGAGGPLDRPPAHPPPDARAGRDDGREARGLELEQRRAMDRAAARRRIPEARAVRMEAVWRSETAPPPSTTAASPGPPTGRSTRWARTGSRSHRLGRRARAGGPSATRGCAMGPSSRRAAWVGAVRAPVDNRPWRSSGSCSRPLSSWTCSSLGPAGGLDAFFTTGQHGGLSWSTARTSGSSTSAPTGPRAGR